MSWVWAVGAGWLVLGAPLGVLIGRSIRLADRMRAASVAAARELPTVVVDFRAFASTRGSRSSPGPLTTGPPAAIRAPRDPHPLGWEPPATA